MNDFLTVLGIISGIAGIVGLLLPAKGWGQRAIHVIYGLVITVLASLAIRYHTNVTELTAIENEAAALIANTKYSSSSEARGFVLASLSFLEKHKAELPDTYARAVQLAENSGVLVNKQENGVDRLVQGWSMWEAAEAMEHLLKGLARSSKAKP